MRKLAIITLLLLTAISAFSEDWEAIKSSNIYLYGEGKGTTVAEADQEALNDLISKISLHISNNTAFIGSETYDGTSIESKSSFSSAVSTYSSATLTNTEKLIIKNEPDAHVGRWIKRSDVAKIFESRKNKISDYISSALKAEQQGKIDIALKDLYWALSLVKTLQDPNEYSYVNEDDESFLAVTWLPHHINEIFDKLKVEIARRKGDDIELSIRYADKPVSSLDYTFFDGRDWSNIYSAKDGVGVLELAPGSQNSHFQMKIEYEYRGEAHIDSEVESVLNYIGSTPMRNAYISLKSEPTTTAQAAHSGKQTRESLATNSFASVSPTIFEMPKEVSDTAQYCEVLATLSNAIVKKQYNGIDQLFTDDAKEIYNGLIKYGKAKIVGTPQYSFYKYGDNVIARGLQLAFSFKTGLRKSFVEDVVFSFDKDNKINNISFGLGNTAEADILGKGVWDENARFAILNFLENYQTAYALKRLDYIKSIFDDDAVIITGTIMHVAGRKSSDNTQTEIAHDIIKHNRHTKDSYIKHLERSFASKEYINLRFANNDVRKLGKGGELYAIQISQEYYSSNYGDKGYLFLMVDINEPDKPIIKVRTWQPDKDPNFGIYGPEHFK